MNIRDFVKTESEKNQAKTNGNQSNNFDSEKILHENEEQVKTLEQDLNRYKNLSQSELLTELVKEANKMKQNGSLNESTISALKSTLSPMLNQEQRENLNNILNMIK